MVFLTATLVLGFAAVNTGNNALMALLGVGLASFAVSGLWSRQVLGGADLELTALPKDVFAGRKVVAEVELRNRSRLFPAYGLVLRNPEGRRLLVEPMLAAGRSSRRRIELEFPNRGWAEIGPWDVEVLLPLGFFLKSKRMLRGRTVLVYPRLLTSSTAAPQEGGVGRTSEGFEDRGREGDVIQLRGYRDGDDTRQMHWKQTARQQRPIVVDRQRRSAVPVVYVVDPRVSDPDDDAVRARFEEMISEVATAVVRRTERGAPVGLVVGATVVAPVRSPRRVGRLLRPLAEVQPQRSDAPPPASGAGVELRICRAEDGR